MVTRVDFGRVFPGLMILLIGIGFFALWVVLALVSFFAFFVPPLQGIFTVALGILVASIVLMVAGGLVMMTGISGWGDLGGPWVHEERSEGGWFGRVAARRASKDRLRIGERFGELVGVAVTLAVGLFFVYNQLLGTGFFTQAFKAPEELLFYGPWVFGMAVSFSRAAYGRRNALRPVEVVQTLFSAIAAFALLAVFPFNFAHFPDLLPQAVRFMAGWINNDVGALILVLAGIGGLASTAYTSVLYVVVRSQLRHGFFASPA